MTKLLFPNYRNHNRKEHKQVYKTISKMENKQTVGSVKTKERGNPSRLSIDVS